MKSRFVSGVLAAAFACAAPAYATLSSAWAVVDSNGTLVRGRNAASAVRNSVGTYSVFFAHTVKNCAFTATPGDPASGTPANGFVTLAGENGNATGVYVAVYDSHGDPADLGFHLNIRC